MQIPFVIQFHYGVGRDHYDLMIPCGQALATWQLDVSPENIDKTAGIAAVKLADHRTAYLSYEGPVSNNRGSVTIYEKGSCEIIETATTRWLVRFDGQRMRGVWEFLDQGKTWLLRPAKPT